jgi:L-aminopeptidase/D-esterase-like protein
MKGLTDIPGIRAGHALGFHAQTGCTVNLSGRSAFGLEAVKNSKWQKSCLAKAQRRKENKGVLLCAFASLRDNPIFTLSDA